MLAAALDAPVHLESDPAALSVPAPDPERAAEVLRRGLDVELAGFSLGQPTLDEVFLALTGHPAEERKRGGGGMSATPATRTEASRGSRSRSTPRSPPASARRARARWPTALTFGWRGMLKIKHVPEQLLDVTVTPVLFLLMFTYLFGGAVAGSTDEYLQFILPGVLAQSVVFTAVYSGVALNTDITKGVVDRFRRCPCGARRRSSARWWATARAT